MHKSYLTAQNLKYSTELFDANIQIEENETQILLVVKSEHKDTQNLPNTYSFLQNNFSRVLKTKCGNDQGLPFYEEVKNTELGHLFEHILIACLCDIREKSGCEKCFYSGVTNWNWLEDNEGVFHITLSTTTNDLDILQDAVEKTITLTSKIVTAKTKEPCVKTQLLC